MTITCYIVDDYPPSLDLLETYIEMTPGLELAARETDPKRAAKQLLEGSVKADLTFLDIEMPGLGGMELARMVKHLTEIIFTTGHRDYAPEAFEVDALDFLLKPVHYDRFMKGVEKAAEIIAKRTSAKPNAHPYIFIPGDGKGSWVKAMYDEIIYIKADSNYLQFVMLDERTRMSYLTIEKVTGLLPPERFCRVHKSFVVNIGMIDEVDTTHVHMTDGSKVPLGRTYKKALMEYINNGS